MYHIFLYKNFFFYVSVSPYDLSVNSLTICIILFMEKTE